MAVLPETPKPLVKTDENTSQNVPEKDNVQDTSLDSSEEKLSVEKDHVLKDEEQNEEKENETVEKKCDENYESVEKMDTSTPDSASDEAGICKVEFSLSFFLYQEQRFIRNDALKGTRPSFSL